MSPSPYVCHTPKSVIQHKCGLVISLFIIDFPYLRLFPYLQVMLKNYCCSVFILLTAYFKYFSIMAVAIFSVDNFVCAHIACTKFRLPCTFMVLWSLF